jgi:hypothetical protein
VVVCLYVDCVCVYKYMRVYIRIDIFMYADNGCVYICKLNIYTYIDMYIHI